ncbi:MAG: hypothetical protein CMJ81_12575 [Planctomycetaceae bacterium]|nr:hypothetical protein [Planctomycetaceae bacterium]MBP63580.1 hypothetical protein [Planctomycetaceae bacterium]
MWPLISIFFCVLTSFSLPCYWNSRHGFESDPVGLKTTLLRSCLQADAGDEIAPLIRESEVADWSRKRLPVITMVSHPSPARLRVDPAIHDETRLAPTIGQMKRVDRQPRLSLSPTVLTTARAARLVSDTVSSVSTSAAQPSHPTPLMKQKRDSNERVRPCTLNKTLDNRSSEWPRPATLYLQLETLVDQLKTQQDHPEVHHWCLQVLAETDRLCGTDRIGSTESLRILQRLRDLVNDGSYHVLNLKHSEQRPELSRVVYALHRRLDLWEPLNKLAQHDTTNGSLPETSVAVLLKQVQAVQTLFEQDNNGPNWTKHFLLDELRQTLESPGSEYQDSCHLAGRILGRFDRVRLSDEQRTYISQTAIRDLTTALKQWTCYGAADYRELLVRLETFESDGRVSDGKFIATQTCIYSRSLHEDFAKAGKTLDQHWRNANLRAAIHQRLLNRYLTADDGSQEAIRGFYSGSHIHGSSWTNRRLKWNLVPDPNRIRLNLLAEGNVRTRTTANSGSVRTTNQGNSTFHAKKSIVLDQQGLQHNETTCSAQNLSKILSVHTEYDGLPLLGDWARSLAKSQAKENIGPVQEYAERLVAQKTKRELDKEFDDQLGQLKREYLSHIIPLADLGLEPKPIHLQTTDQRIIARYRLAGRHQLAAYSPRPQAPSDSLLSVQLHESALNNLVEQLYLNGKRFKLEDLYVHFARQMGEKEPSIPDDLPSGIELRFAQQEPLRFTFHNGHVRVTLRLFSLTRGRRDRWRNVTVHGDYLPNPSAMQGSLVREKGIQLTGRRLGFADQVALRTIFSTVFSRNREYTLLSQQLAQAQQFQDLKIHQFVIRDGWIGIAWGLPRLASR